MPQRASSFTAQSGKILSVLQTSVKVGPAFDKTATAPGQKEYIAIWDTGATACVITERIITECGLKPISMVKAHGADGEYTTEVFLVSLLLPNSVGFRQVHVTRGKLVGLADMLIGMDVISQGDFAVTNTGGKTCFSFRCPSSERIDFTGKAPPTPTVAPASNPPKIGRNDLCPCGSGKKYKKCCLR